MVLLLNPQGLLLLLDLLLRYPDIVDLVGGLLVRGPRVAQVMDGLVGLYQPLSVGCRPPVDGLDHVAPGNESGGLSN